MHIRWRLLIAKTVGAILLGVVTLSSISQDLEGLGGAAPATLKDQYTRPKAIPFPSENPYSEVKAKLGRKLFFDTRLSGKDTIACASCHIPALAWEDGREKAVGEDGQILNRHTPTLWNLAWGEFFFWDGRAASLEEQALLPIQTALEMNQSLEALVASLQRLPEYRRAFAAAFPENPSISSETITKALATVERTLVSPETPFDRWIAGDEKAISKAAQRGFMLFNTKANCAACHSGWAFTDHAFHDIGLSGNDEGRGAVLALPEVAHAFKTPTLRDITRRAPYMHDGSLPTLEAVIDHYNGGFRQRPTLSSDLRAIALSTEEKTELLAFLETLTTSDTKKESLHLPSKVMPQIPDNTAATLTQSVSQRNKAFHPNHIKLSAGATLKIRNDDTRTHNLRIHDPALDYNSGAQEPGETAEITFREPGTYYIFCGIHPKMKLVVEVP
jgi:cytochrome c peroxidase